MATEAKVTAVIEAKDKASGVIDNIGDSFGSLNTKVLKTVGAIGIVGGAMAKAINDTSEFNVMIARAGANVEASGEQLRMFKQVAIDATKSTNFNATQAAAALYQLAGGSISAEEAMEGLQQAIKFATANGLDDLDESAITVANVMNLFKLSGDSASRAMDVLTVAGHAAYGTTQDLVSAFKEVAPAASQLGISIEETSGLLAALADKGFLGSEAGVILKRALEQLVAPTGAAKENIDRLGIVTSDAEGNFVGLANVLDQLEEKLSNTSPMERAAIMSETFGQIAGPGMTALLSQGKDGRDEFIAQMNEAAGATDTAAAAIEKANNPLNELHNQLFEIETNVAPIAIEIFKGLAFVLDLLAKAFKLGYDAAVDFLSDGLFAIMQVGQFLSDKVFPAIGKAIESVIGILERAIDAIQRFFKAASKTVKGAGSAVGNAFSKVGNAIGNLFPSFDAGGVVPGAIGAPMMAVVHGGERVIPNSGGKAAAGSGGINITITGNTIASHLDMRELAERVGEEMMRALRATQQV